MGGGLSLSNVKYARGWDVVVRCETRHREFQ